MLATFSRESKDPELSIVLLAKIESVPAYPLDEADLDN